MLSILVKSWGSLQRQILVKYLGIPLLHKRVTRSTFAYLIDKSTKKLSAWNAKTLSFAGRLTLSKTVLEAIPSYTMQTTFIPVGICNQLEKYGQNFLRGSTTERKKVHGVNWDEVC